MAYWALFTHRKRPQKAPNHTLQWTGGKAGSAYAIGPIKQLWWCPHSPLSFRVVIGMEDADSHATAGNVSH
jgi:hypothetical protein